VRNLSIRALLTLAGAAQTASIRVDLLNDIIQTLNGG
jgi:hypothetical protein